MQKAEVELNEGDAVNKFNSDATNTDENQISTAKSSINSTVIEQNSENRVKKLQKRWLSHSSDSRLDEFFKLKLKTLHQLMVVEKQVFEAWFLKNDPKYHKQFKNNVLSRLIMYAGNFFIST
jgi:hypothetical protein